MREPPAGAGPFGLMAEFDAPERLIEAVKRVRAAGLRQVEAYSPFPIEGLAEEMGFRENRVPWLTFAGGVFGAAAGFGMQVYTNLDYPIDIGGRPLIATPAFMLITFEMTVLFAVLGAICGMLLLNRLPRLHHPLFGAKQFQLASSTKFFLVVFSNDEKFDEASTADLLATLAPVCVQLVEQSELPE